MNLLDIARAALAEVAPSPQVARAAATPEQAAELRALLARITATWSDDDKAEALAVALADPADALTCFRALAAELPVADTKVICLDAPSRGRSSATPREMWNGR